MTVAIVADAFQTIRAAEAASSYRALVELATDWSGRFGMPYIVLTRLAEGASGAEPASLVLDALPPALSVRYENDRLWSEDPLVLASITNGRPTRLAEVRQRNGVGAAQTMLSLLAQTGLSSGIAVPVWGVGRMTGIVTHYGDGQGDEADLESALALTAPTLFRRALTLAPERFGEFGRVGVKPSPRELECLQASAEGNSSLEIAQALGLSEHTVNTHLRSAIDKLKARSRVQAVAEALRRQWIS